ncbi:SDR family oxidoreductase [Pontibacter sp. BT310]|uniref:SDR family oxidoreductase n=1 Tax=Pontibacter populi TaxID=890055 RepID=A0ABS6X6G7_9BACT|nr:MULTISPECIES: SDR family oxidoreductase [Pontibacter]MBJ6116732.1 SDR family oxidoreductase [Pontibacter sp. BT310]MBR0569156.1 SDR family oxidoreductase [Microvirga sp. STS03]MBW3363586.1 SDR family oxidoreductase [Pontibacter populi]
MKDKVVLITGGTSGIGKACAFAFGKAGAKVAVSGRNQQNLDQTSQELSAAGIKNVAINADVSKEADCLRMVQETVDRFGKLDVLINNAGISMRALFEDLDLDVIRKVMDINFWGTVYTTKFALPYIMAARGSVIGISSIAGYRGLPARTGYSASKFAMHGFLETLRTEMLHKGVHVLIACPGFTASNIRNTALAANGQQQGESPRDEGNMMTAEEVADQILKATIKRKRDLVMTFQGKLTVFLNKWLPGLTDKLVYNVMAKEKDSPLK